MATDEHSARQLLLAMQERLSRDPYEALGLTNSDPASVRTAFLSLTKVYHPARFARMSTEIHRLSNEVFLSLRAAHDALTRAQVKAPAPRTTGTIPTFRPAAPTGSSGRPPTGTIPVVRPAGTSTTGAPPPTARPTPPAPTSPTPARPTSSARAPGPPGRGATTPAGGNPTSGARPPSPPVTTATQTTQSMRPIGATPPAAPVRPTRMPSSSPPPSTVPHGAGTSGRLPVAGRADEDPEVAVIHELLAQDRLTDARIKLEVLVARRPDVPRYHAMIHYTKGREAQLAKRIDEARVELMDALQLDPDLQFAKTAQVELLTKRK